MIQELSREQFDVLSNLSSNLGNPIITELESMNYIKDGTITNLGVEALEPYRVKRAIFFAAGFGSRMSPITINTPKPLVRVHGKRIIDGLIDAVLNAEITEIYIVRGYLSEQFDQLLYKYPMIKFIENPAYNDANNISSAMCVRYLLSGAYVFEADLLINNPNIIKKYHYTSNFLGIKKQSTDDWCFDVDKNIITSQKISGSNCYQEVGISYWDNKDGLKLAEHIKSAYETANGKNAYWDQIPFVYFPDSYNVEIRECTEEDIVEIDTLSELKVIDKTYDI